MATYIPLSTTPGKRPVMAYVPRSDGELEYRKIPWYPLAQEREASPPPKREYQLSPIPKDLTWDDLPYRHEGAEWRDAMSTLVLQCLQQRETAELVQERPVQRPTLLPLRLLEDSKQVIKASTQSNQRINLRPSSIETAVSSDGAARSSDDTESEGEIHLTENKPLPSAFVPLKTEKKTLQGSSQERSSLSDAWKSRLAVVTLVAIGAAVIGMKCAALVCRSDKADVSGLFCHAIDTIVPYTSLPQQIAAAFTGTVVLTRLIGEVLMRRG